jgi:hypothetical protein
VALVTAVTGITNQRNFGNIKTGCNHIYYNTNSDCYINAICHSVDFRAEYISYNLFAFARKLMHNIANNNN